MKKIRLTERELVKMIKKIINEQLDKFVTGGDTTKKDECTLGQEDYEWCKVCQIAKEIETFWEGSDGEHEKFFEKFQGGFMALQGDNDEGAAMAYKEKLDTYRVKLIKLLKGGKSNPYYTKMDAWFNQIVDEIDDNWMAGQDVCTVSLTNPGGDKIEYFSVDPEID